MRTILLSAVLFIVLSAMSSCTTAYDGLPSNHINVTFFQDQHVSYNQAMSMVEAEYPGWHECTLTAVQTDDEYRKDAICACQVIYLPEKYWSYDALHYAFEQSLSTCEIAKTMYHGE